MEKALDVSIIIVNYNTRQLLSDCLCSVYEQTKDISFEVFVSDNGSTDGSIEMLKREFPQVVLIENGANLGFGAANNRALAKATGKYVFYLNSDTLLLNNAVKLFFDYWENAADAEQIGAIGANLIGSDNQLVHSYGYFSRPIFFVKSLLRRYGGMTVRMIFPPLRNYKSKNMQFSFYEGDVEYVTGADLFLRNNSDAYFDERYFMYAEEADLQYQLFKKDLKRRIIGTPQIVHLEGASDKAKDTTLLQQYASFGKIYTDISNLKFVKFNISKFWFYILRIFVFVCWLHPCVIKNTKKYFKELVSL